MGAIFELLGGDLILYAGIAITAIIAFLGNNKYQRNKGGNKEKAKQKEADNEKAGDIRDAVDGVKPVSDDNIEYRD